MKNTKLFILSLLFLSFFSKAQDIKNLDVYVSDSFDATATIALGKITTSDPARLNNYLEEALLSKKFKIIPKEIAEKKAANTDKKTAPIYLVQYKYSHRDDTGCNGKVISKLNGKIIDLTNDHQTVATFSFQQGGWTGICTQTVSKAIINKLKK